MLILRLLKHLELFIRGQTVHLSFLCLLNRSSTKLRRESKELWEIRWKRRQAPPSGEMMANIWGYRGSEATWTNQGAGRSLNKPPKISYFNKPLDLTIPNGCCYSLALCLWVTAGFWNKALKSKFMSRHKPIWNCTEADACLHKSQKAPWKWMLFMTVIIWSILFMRYININRYRNRQWLPCP